MRMKREKKSIADRVEKILRDPLFWTLGVLALAYFIMIAPLLIRNHGSPGELSTALAMSAFAVIFGILFFFGFVLEALGIEVYTDSDFGIFLGMAVSVLVLYFYWAFFLRRLRKIDRRYLYYMIILVLLILMLGLTRCLTDPGPGWIFFY